MIDSCACEWVHGSGSVARTLINIAIANLITYELINFKSHSPVKNM